MSKLFDIIGENLVIEKIAKEDIMDPKVSYSKLDIIDKNILRFCNTPRTDSHIKQFFVSRDENGDTIDFDNRIQFLRREGFLDHAYTKYVVNPKYRQFITVMPMTASKIALDNDAIISDIEKYEKGGLVESQIVLKLSEKYNISEATAYDILKSSKHFEKHITEKEADETPVYGTGGDLGLGVIDRTEREETRESLIGPKVSYSLKKKSTVNKDATKYYWYGQELAHYKTHDRSSLPNLKVGDLVLDMDGDLPDRLVDIDLDEIGYDKEQQAPIYEIIKPSYFTAKRASIKQASYYVKQQLNKTSINKSNIHYEATNFVRRFLSNYKFPLPPTIKFNAIKSASLDEDSNLNGEVTLSIEFRTLSNLKKRADITVPIINGQLIEPSVILVDGQAHIISQSAIDCIAKGATFYTNVSPRKNHLSGPVPRILENMYKDKKVPTIKKDIFSI